LVTGNTVTLANIIQLVNAMDKILVIADGHGREKQPQMIQLQTADANLKQSNPSRIHPSLNPSPNPSLNRRQVILKH
jgi:hypothetical protein